MKAQTSLNCYMGPHGPMAKSCDLLVQCAKTIYNMGKQKEGNRSWAIGMVTKEVKKEI